MARALAIHDLRERPQHAEAVVRNARAMLDDEAARLVLLRKAKTAAEVRAASSGGAYTPKKG